MASELNTIGNRSVDPSHSSVAPIIPISIVSGSRLLQEGLVMLLKPYITVELISSIPALPIPPVNASNPRGHIVLVDSNIGLSALIDWTCYWRNLDMPAWVLGVEMEDNAETVLASIEAGINGYVLRGAAPTEVAEAIRTVQSGCANCSPQMIAQLFARLAAMKAMNAGQTFAAVSLTSRELQVLDLIAKGYSNKEIALALCITLRTVKHHVHQILNKLQLKHRREAATLALERGWVGSLRMKDKVTYD